MKRYIKTAYVISFMALALAGCSKAEEFQTNSDSALQIESVSGISPFDLMQNQASKAVITGESLPSDEAAKGIGLFVTADDGGAYDGHDSGYTNVKYTFDGSKWSTQSPIYLSSNEGNLYGYFPYNPDATDLRAIPVESSLNGTDYLYADIEEVSHSDKTVKLQMNHALSRLHLTIKKGENFTAEATLSEITLKSAAIDATGTMDLTTGVITASKKSGETGIVELATDGRITAVGIEKDILLVPADNTIGKKDLSLTLTIDGSDAKINFSEDNGLDIRSGIQNNVVLTIEDTGIKINGVEVGEWDEQDSHQVPAGVCTVTVKLAEEQLSKLADDIVFVITPGRKEDGKVIIEALSKSQKRLECYLSGKASCHTETGSPVGSCISYIFTISDITANTTVTIGYPRPKNMSLQVSSNTTYVGCSFKLKETILPDDTYNKNFTWSSSNPSVATVDENGRVKAKAEGTAKITATTEVGGITATCTVSVKPFGDLIISGKFSVGSSKYVHFSRGNLRYTPNIESWQFFDRQYGCGHSQNELSLFTWGYGSWSTVWDTDKYESGNFTDWGTQIGDGNTWRTLTSNEWEYLLYTRTGAADKIGYATVCGTHGLLLLPDEFDDPRTNESTSESCEEKKFVPKSSTGWDQNIYNSEDSWNKMEAAGAVFLPAAGRFTDGDVAKFDEAGIYWSSYINDSPNVQGYNRIFMNDIITYGSVNGGNSVRLVTECKQ